MSLPNRLANVIDKLPSSGAYRNSAKVAELVSPPDSILRKMDLEGQLQHSADTSLVLFGLDQGVDSMPKCLAVEPAMPRVRNTNLNADDFHFIDGSGGGDSAQPLSQAIVSFLQQMRKKRFSPHLSR